VEISSKTVGIVLVVIAAFSLMRIISQWRKFSFKKTPIDWDAHFIQGLRKAGLDTFSDHTVDFFFTIPTRDASEQMARVLRADGFEVDVLEATDLTGQFSVHASRRMRLIIPDMQALTARFNQLAESHGGRYDNWAVVTK
jgi:hypothetical protein